MDVPPKKKQPPVDKELVAVGKYSVFCNSESVASAQATIYKKTVLSFKVEFACFLSFELDDKKFTVFQQEIVTAVHKTGEELLLTVSM